jgi:hypothetical protein
VGAELAVEADLRQEHLARAQRQAPEHIREVPLLLQQVIGHAHRALRLAVDPHDLEAVIRRADQAHLEVVGIGAQHGVEGVGQRRLALLLRGGVGGRDAAGQLELGQEAHVVGHAADGGGQPPAEHLGGGHQVALGRAHQQVAALRVRVQPGQAGGQHAEGCEQHAQAEADAEAHGH